ncbi:CDP-alcohol phosphatidyltransferase [Phlyctochytrium arcticum]|nr:CDP-alcohol phosphatidyltransferase [Phlyctochytrium arcticum]
MFPRAACRSSCLQAFPKPSLLSDSLKTTTTFSILKLGQASIPRSLQSFGFSRSRLVPGLLSSQLQRQINPSPFRVLSTNATPPEGKPAEGTSPQKLLAKEDIYTIPNILTMGRIAVTPVIGYLIVTSQFHWALGTLIVAGLSDLVDGWIARKYKMTTFLGSALDPAADKILMTVLTVSLASASLLPMSLAYAIIGRDVALVAGTAYVRYKSLPAPKTTKRYFDLTLPSAEVRPPYISKVNTLFQLVLMSASVAAPVFGYTDHILLEALQMIVWTTTIWSGAQYAFDKRVIRYLPPNK